MNINRQTFLTRPARLALVMIIFLGLSFPGHISGDSGKPRLYLKLNVTGTNPYGGDFGKFIDHNKTYFDSLNQQPGYTVSMDKDPYFQGYGGEIGVEVKRFAVGISAGYISRTYSQDFRFENPDNGNIQQYTHQYKFSAIPLFLFIHYRLIDTKLFSGYLTIGEGVYLGKLRDDLNVTETAGTQVTSSTSFLEASRNQLGFHIGATIDIKVASFLTVYIDAGYRAVKFKEITAENTFAAVGSEPVTAEGDLYYWYNTRTGEPRLRIGDEVPSARWEANPAIFDLDGLSLSFGLKIYLGSGKTKLPPKVAPVDDY